MYSAAQLQRRLMRRYMSAESHAEELAQDARTRAWEARHRKCPQCGTVFDSTEPARKAEHFCSADCAAKWRPWD